MRAFASIVLALTVPVSEATRKVAVPPWACAVAKCSQHSIDEEIADDGPSPNTKVLLALRGAVKAQVLCPFGGDGGGKGASKAEAKSFFDGFEKAYDELHGIKGNEAQVTDEVKAEEKKEVQEKQAPVTAAPVPVAGTPAPVAAAPDAIQQVDRQSLSQLVDAHKQDLLVVFYAPWCPHCQAFVLAEQAPINSLASAFAATNGPKVVTFDTTASSIPPGFNANFVPTIMLVSKDGRMSEFLEDPTEVEHLKAFALAGVQ